MLVNMGALVLVLQDGETEEINIEQLKEHVDMYGKDENYKAEEHINDIVQVGLPIPFLKVRHLLFFINLIF